MTDFNTVLIGGNLVKDSQVKKIGNKSLTTFSIAVNRSVKKGDQWENEASFIECEMWEKDYIIPSLVKGTKVVIGGYVKQERWETEGQKHYKIVIVVNDIQCITIKKNENSLTNNTGNGSVEVTESDFPEDMPF